VYDSAILKAVHPVWLRTGDEKTLRGMTAALIMQLGGTAAWDALAYSQVSKGEHPNGFVLTTTDAGTRFASLPGTGL
jgi:hypothetical protein